MQKCLRKPKCVDFVQITHENLEEVARWVNGIVARPFYTPPYIWARNLWSASIGEFIVKDDLPRVMSSENFHKQYNICQEEGTDADL